MVAVVEVGVVVVVAVTLLKVQQWHILLLKINRE